MKLYQLVMTPHQNSIWRSLIYIVVAIFPLTVIPSVVGNFVSTIALMLLVGSCLFQAIRPTIIVWILITLTNFAILILCIYYLVDQYHIYEKFVDQDHNEFEGWESFMKLTYFIIGISFSSGLLVASVPRNPLRKIS